ncbi:MAG: iron ABC transporter permease [Myxococcales bacterium]|nr:iron ABC transporter permease [Myxococcales bacterium]
MTLIRPRRGRTPTLLLPTLALLAAAAAALGVGTSTLSPGDVWATLAGDAPSPLARLLVLEVRLPRVLAAALVGANLAAAGALMQGITRNPLASPGLMGLNAGGGLAMLIAILAWPHISDAMLFVALFVGAAGGATLVFGTAALGRGPASPERLALAGVVVSGLVTSITGYVVLHHGMTQDRLSWTAGGLYSIRWAQVAASAPIGGLGLVGALALAPQVTLLALGVETAAGLGVHPGRTRAAVTAAVLLLVVSSLALAGPVAFLGLMVPHLTRRLVGDDYRSVIPVAMLLGATLALLADLAGRSATFQGAEVPLGVYTALIGAVFFIVLARGLRTGRGWAC